jgi:hypothetical protein
MARTDRSGEPLVAAAGAAGPQTTEALGLLGDETRLSILLALWEAYDPSNDNDAVSFSELRERVDIRDSGQFNYHLGKLEDHFLRKTDEGYALRRSGLRLVQSIIAGTGIEEPEFDPTEIDATCPYCEAPTAVTYDNANVYQVCTECDGGVEPDDIHPTGTILGWTFEPAGLTGRTATEVFAASTLKTFARIRLRFEDICPECSGPVEWTLDVCADHDPSEDECPNCGRVDPARVRETCTVCKSAGQGTPGIKVLFHPAVVAFYYNRGIEIGMTGDTSFEDVIRTLELSRGFEEEVVSAEPPRIRVTVPHEDDELRLLLDEDMNVVDVNDPG